jgi:hypothetical protein
MSTFLAGLRSRRWLNIGVFVLGALSMLVAVATPLYARSSSEHVLDQRTLQRPNIETGLQVEVAPPSDEAGGTYHPITVASVPAGQDRAADGQPPEPLSDSTKQGMVDTALDLASSDAASTYWHPPVGFLESTGSTQPVGGVQHPIRALWRDRMCDHATVVGRCPAGPDEALIDPTMLRTLQKKVGDQVTIEYTVFAGDDKKATTFTQAWTIVGTYTIADATDAYWFDPAHTVGDGLLRPPPGGDPPLPAPSLLVDQAGIGYAAVGGAERAIDLRALDIDTMDAANADLVEWQGEIAGQAPPVLQSDDPASLLSLFEDVRAEQHLLSQITLAAIVPLVVLALLLLYVLVSSAAEVRRQEVALAKLRGFSSAKVVRFAVAEPVAVLLFAVPVGIALAVAASRFVTDTWLGQTPFVVTPQAVASAVIVTVAALAGAFVAVLGVVREPLAASLASATRRRTTSRWALLAQGALVMLSAAAVVQVVTSDATQSSSLLELLTPLFVALGASVLALVGLGALARLWMSRTSARGGLSPFLASRRLVRRQDLMQLVLPLLLATAMATFAASAWKVADDWRVSKAAATVGAPTVYFTDSSPAQLYWLTHEIDPDGRYLAAFVPPTPRTIDVARVALVDSPRFARVSAWDPSWGTGPSQVQGWLSSGVRADPVTWTGNDLTFELTGIALKGKLNLPVSLWMRYVDTGTGQQEILPMGELPLKGDATIEGFASGCEQGCELQQLYLSGSSSSVTDVHGTFTIAAVATDGEDPGDWRLTDASAWRAARPFGTSDTAPVSLSAGAGGLTLDIAEGEPTVVRITTTDLPDAPAMVATTGTKLDDAGRDEVEGASLIGTRTPMQVTGRADALPVVGNNGGISDLGVALREYGDLSTDVSLTELLVASGTPRSVIADLRKAGVDLSTVRTESGELHQLRSDAFSLGWKVFLLVGVLTLALAFLGVLALAIVQLRWRSYEVAALRVVGVRRRDLSRAILTEYVALLGMAVVGGALAAVAALLLVLPSLDIGVVGTFDPAVDYDLRWLVLGGVLGVVLLVVLVIAWWIARRTVRLGTPATLRQADVR